MGIRESVLVALDTLWSHKLRSFLTLLGIIVSIWTLVAVVSLVQGVNKYVGDKIAGLGSNVIDVNQFSLDDMTDQKRFRQAQKSNKPISLAEYQYLRANASLAAAVAASAGRQAGTTLKAGTHSMTDINVSGQTENSIALATYTVVAGRFLDAADERHDAPVAFLGADVAQKLFPGVDPMGQQFSIDGHNFTAIGQASVQGNVFGQSQDSFVVIPLGVYRGMYGTRDSLDVNVKAPSALMLGAVSDQVRVLMRNIRHLRYQDKDTFGLIGADSLMALFHQLTGVIAAVMIGVSFVFLVVGGIVIMNIML
ncbi:MAG: ABC transporter permease, partial [Terriglobales bacterium]